MGVGWWWKQGRARRLRLCPACEEISVNGTGCEHLVWRCGRGARRRGRRGGCCPPVEPAAGAGPGRPSCARQHAREPAAGRTAPRPALDGKRFSGPGGGAVRGGARGGSRRRRLRTHPAAAPAPAAPLHVPARSLSLGSNFKSDAPGLVEKASRG